MLRTVEIFLRRTGMSPTRFGREAVRDPRLVLDMRRGREPTQRMCRRLNHFIALHDTPRQPGQRTARAVSQRVGGEA